MGYVFDFKDAKASDQWWRDPRNSLAAELKRRLVFDLLNPRRGESVLDIGCGTGENLVEFLDRGIKTTGLDASPYMLDFSLKKVANRVDLYRGFAEDLPFDDDSFNCACLITTLEFVDHPQKAIEEACRVAKDRVFLGVMNRYAIEGIRRRVQGIFVESIYKHARFFSVWELKQTLRDLLGDVPISWRTVCQLPSSGGRIISRIERSQLVQKVPFGAFAGMVVTLVPRFKTRPLAIMYQPKRTSSATI